MKLKEFKNNILPLRDKLFRIALRVTCNKEEAEDIVQDIMLKMWQLRDEWNKIQNLEAYCCMMSRNLAIGRLTLKDNQHISTDNSVFEIKDETSISGMLEEAEMHHLLRSFISGLPEKEKSVIELRDIESMSYKEIATMLEIPESQVKINLFRGRQKLKELFKRIN